MRSSRLVKGGRVQRRAPVRPGRGAAWILLQAPGVGLFDAPAHRRTAAGGLGKLLCAYAQGLLRRGVQSDGLRPALLSFDPGHQGYCRHGVSRRIVGLPGRNASKFCKPLAEIRLSGLQPMRQKPSVFTRILRSAEPPLTLTPWRSQVRALCRPLFPSSGKGPPGTANLIAAFWRFAKQQPSTTASQPWLGCAGLMASAELLPQAVVRSAALIATCNDAVPRCNIR